MPLTTDHAPILMDIRLDAPDMFVLDAVQQRATLDPEKVYEYADLYREGRDLGRLVVFHTEAESEDEFYLADGFHRRLAALEAGLTTLPAEVHEGTIRDAILYATSCNLHGKPLSNADKRKRVTTLLQDPAWQQWSDNAIAKHCGVTQPFVSSVRKSLITVIRDDADPVPTTRTYTDGSGQVRTMDTSQIGRHAPEPPPATFPLPPSNGTRTASPASAIFTEMQDAAAPEAPTTTLPRQGTGDAERYTPREWIERVRAVLGTIDVDPASCAMAQAVVQATTFYTLYDNGLHHYWPGTVFLNPPYGWPEVEHFCGKLVEEWDAGRTTAAIILVNSATETTWFQLLLTRATVVCFPEETDRLWASHPHGFPTAARAGLLLFRPGSHPLL